MNQPARQHSDTELQLLRLLAAGATLFYAVRCLRKEGTLAVAVADKEAMRGRFQAVEGIFEGAMDGVRLPPHIKESLKHAGREIITNLGEDYVYGKERKE